MKWKQKAMIQKLIARIPSSISYDIYYFIQRKFGGLRNINHQYSLLQGIKILDSIYEQDLPIDSTVFLEIGTGRGLNIPLVLWLSGACKITTIDINLYLKEDIVFELISYMRNNQRQIVNLFGRYSQNKMFSERFNQLLISKTDLSRLLAITNIHYLAPADATCLELPPESIDYHISDTVFEHIAPEILEGILMEGKRLLRKNGIFIHGISLSDHFSHSDKSISAINFLQFDEKEWKYYAGNRYMYHNRFRIDDYITLFNRVGLKVLSISTVVDQRSLEELRKGFPLNERFKDKGEEINATRSARIVASIGIGQGFSCE